MNVRMQIGMGRIGDLVAWGSGTGVIVRAFDSLEHGLERISIRNVTTYWTYPVGHGNPSGLDPSYLRNLSVELLAR